MCVCVCVCVCVWRHDCESPQTAASRAACVEFEACQYTTKGRYMYDGHKVCVCVYGVPLLCLASNVFPY